MKVDTNPTWQNLKYIYLDWNVYKYMISPRPDKNDEDMLNLVKKLKGKYIFPYSAGHIKDRCSRFKEEYRKEVESDFHFAETINDKWMLISKEQVDTQGSLKLNSTNDIVIAKASMIDYFNGYQAMLQSEGACEIRQPDDLKFADFQVDMNQLSPEHPLYGFLKNHNGVMSAKGLNEFLEYLFTVIFENIDEYKKLRNAVKNVDTNDLWNRALPIDYRLQLDRLLYFMTPMLDSCTDDEEQLAKKWKGIIIQWFKMSGSNPPIEYLLKEGYVLLDMHPLFNDKLKKNKNTLDNIVRDGNHCFYASHAKYFVSEDEETRRKTQLMYKAFGITTKVVSESEFLNIFQIV